MRFCSIMTTFRSRTSISNTVQPHGYALPSKSVVKVNSSSELPTETRNGASKQHASGELPTEALIEASRQLPARLEKLQQENDCLRGKVELLQRSLEDTESISSENKQLLVEVENLKQRLAALAERKVNNDQRRTENMLSTNRQSDLEREYKNEFRDGERVEAIDTIEAYFTKKKKKNPKELSPVEQLQAYRLASYIFEVSYECASNTKESFLNFYYLLMETLTTEAPKFGLLDRDDKLKKISDLKLPNNQNLTARDSFTDSLVLVKEKARIHNLEKVVKAAKKEVKKNWQGKGGKGEIIPIFDKNLYRKLKGYIEYCTKFSWRIVTQAPPLKIAYETSPFNPCDHTESQAFASSSLHSSHERWVDSQKRKEIKCFVWPTLRDCDNRVIEKGHVVLMEHTPHVTFL